MGWEVVTTDEFDDWFTEIDRAMQLDIIAGRRNRMAKKFRNLAATITPTERAHVDAKKTEMLAEMRLYDLRRARSMSQITVAEAMGVPQSAISKIERRTDAYIGTIRRYLEAMGGTLHIIAEFPDGKTVEINQFSEIPDVDLVEATT